MYELLSGFRPFRAGSLSKLLHQIVYATPQPLHTLRPELSEALELVVVKALQKDPEQRYAHGLEFAGALTAALALVYVGIRAAPPLFLLTKISG
jgi:eukaryotic-like serine/threonine-protein kinase